MTSMSKNNLELFGIIFAIIEFDINYFVYRRTGSVSNVLMVVTVSLILALAFILSDVYSKIKDIEENQEEFNKKIIRNRELEDIRLDLREIKRYTIKNEKK